MKKNEKDYRPGMPPVRRIELPEVNGKFRWIAIAVLLSIAVVAIGRGLYSLVDVEPGWHTVEVSSNVPNCSRDFAFQYDFSDAGGSASSQLRTLNQVYQKATEDAWKIFSVEAEGSLSELNAQVNKPVNVDPALYRALSVFDEKTAPYLFLAPAAVEYDRVFLAQEDAEAAQYDPSRNPEMVAWLGELTAFINDPNHISLELLEENQVRVNVSDAYLAFSEENDIGVFLDFGWMKNAFIVDFLAEVLIENGFTRGFLASYDGFTRNLDDRGGDYAMNLFDRQGTDLYAPARFHYAGPMSLVSLRDFPMSERDSWHYYAYESGEILTAFLDPRDAMSKASIPALLGYAPDKGCGEILTELLDVFIAEKFYPQDLGQTVDALWFEGSTLCHTQADANLELLPNSGGLDYQIQ